jgi:deoxyadenosine/deoxycytidine kinase
VATGSYGKELRAIRYTVCYEPIEDWTALLTLMYADPSRWRFLFQMRVLHHYTSVFKKYKDSEEIIFIERSLASALVFVTMAIERGHLTDEETDTYMLFHTENHWEPDETMYLNTHHEVCYARMKSRGREAEKKVSEEYLKELDALYKQSPIANSNVIITAKKTEFMIAMDILKQLDLKTASRTRSRSL